VGTSIFELSAERSSEAVDAADLHLVDSLREGSERAYEELLVRFQQPVYALALRLLDDQSEACDVVQEVFLKVFRNVDTFRGDSSLKTWVYRIAVNEAHNRRRWLFRHRRGETGIEETYEDSEGRERALQDQTESPFEFTMNREAQILLEEGLAALNPAYRAAVVLREVEDMSYEEIAAVLDVSIGTVKSRILRGREGLRKYLATRLAPVPSMQLAPRGAK